MGDAMIVPDGLGEVVAGVVLALEGTGADKGPERDSCTETSP
jgi:hypothetical protein